MPVGRPPKGHWNKRAHFRKPFYCRYHQIGKSVIGESLRGPKSSPTVKAGRCAYYFRISSGPGYDIEADADGSTLIYFDASTLINAAGICTWQIIRDNEGDEKHFTSSG